LLKRFAWTVIVGVFVLSFAANAAERPYIVLQSTTSTQNSGLFDYLLPMYRKLSGVEVRSVAVGTGQALRNARSGDADVLLVHAKSAEEEFVAEGYGVARYDLMYNDFVVVGPKSDPARVGGATDVVGALRKIANASAIFASRGDDSGTHKKERALWAVTGIDIDAASGTWYRETGSGMGATLNIATGNGAYVMSDRATWIGFKNKRDFSVQVEGDSELFNQYGIILVNPKKHPHANVEAGQAFIDWLLSEPGQQAIGAFNVNGKQLFYPNAQFVQPQVGGKDE
jgi:tungstate transport system substrate-binding protein